MNPPSANAGYKAQAPEKSVMSEPAEEARPQMTEADAEAKFTLDLPTGSFLDGAIGMDESQVRAALTKNGVAGIEKVDYPDQFLLQTRDYPGITWRFRDRRTLTEIHTNSRKVVLSNGLRLGDPVEKFTEELGQPAAPWPLPSGVGEELTYPVGEFDLGVIRLNENPETAHAMTLRRKKSREL